MSSANFNPSYVGQRPDVVDLVPANATRVLDVGCSNGTLGAALKARSSSRVVGIEISPDMAAHARVHLDEVHVGDALQIFDSCVLDAQRFDALIFADVLEHTADPWLLLKRAKALMAPGGCVVISLPNVRHIDTLYNLAFKGTWPHRDRGIHDRTHLRFFTRRTMIELLASAGLAVEVMTTNYRIIERPHDWNRFAHWCGRLPGFKEFFAFQYLVRARETTR
jgi:2-polyprenyl-3-methyl-5-hydroxy-6-metoxy-1,4-benzoquinol methylase